MMGKLEREREKKEISIELYGDVEVAFEIENAAFHFDVLQVVAALGAEEIFLHELLEKRLIVGKIDCLHGAL